MKQSINGFVLLEFYNYDMDVDHFLTSGTISAMKTSQLS